MTANNPFRLTIKWHIDYTLLPKCYAWVRGETPTEFDGLLYDETITPEDGELTSEELARRLEAIIDENARRDMSGKLLDPMAAYTSGQLQALANQIRRAKSKVEDFAYTVGNPPRDPWLEAVSINGNDTPWGDRGGWVFRADWKLKDSQTEKIWLWLTPIKCVEV